VAEARGNEEDQKEARRRENRTGDQAEPTARVSHGRACVGREAPRRWAIGGGGVGGAEPASGGGSSGRRRPESELAAAAALGQRGTRERNEREGERIVCA
jgi:hypothetical protein